MLQSTKNFKVGDSVVFVGDEKSLRTANLANMLGGALYSTDDKKYVQIEYDKVGVIKDIDDKLGVCGVNFEDGYAAVCLADLDIVENKSEEKEEETNKEEYDFNININLNAHCQKGVITDLKTGIKHEFENEDLNCFTENLGEKLEEVITTSLIDRVFYNLKDLLGDEND